jgi:hypothetical protein
MNSPELLENYWGIKQPTSRRGREVELGDRGQEVDDVWISGLSSAESTLLHVVFAFDPFMQTSDDEAGRARVGCGQRIGPRPRLFPSSDINEGGHERSRKVVQTNLRCWREMTGDKGRRHNLWSVGKTQITG